MSAPRAAADRWLPPALAASREDRAAVSMPRAAEHLGSIGAAPLAALDDQRIEAAFLGAVAALRDPSSPERRGLDPALRRSTALSQGSLDASLAALLDGFTRDEVRAVLAAARRRRGRPRLASPARAGQGSARDRPARPHLIVLAANLPGIVLQPLLASLAARRPAIVKSSSREPFFAPALLAALAAREPALGGALAALAWRGGDRAIEEPLLDAVDRVIAYGGAIALADLRRRVAPERLIAFGPKASVALVAGGMAGAALERTARALARDVALFDQRGCLSLQAVYTDGDGEALAEALARALDDAARRWPPRALEAAEAGALRLAREEAVFLGGSVGSTPLDRATVIHDRRLLFLPTPGHRTVRVHSLDHLDAAISILRPHGARLQGAALEGREALALGDELAALGVSYLCAPGQLQSPGASWANGGIDLVAALATPAPAPSAAPK